VDKNTALEVIKVVAEVIVAVCAVVELLRLLR
jgi:hypothetical protein